MCSRQDKSQRQFILGSWINSVKRQDSLSAKTSGSKIHVQSFYRLMAMNHLDVPIIYDLSNLSDKAKIERPSSVQSNEFDS